MKKVSTAAAKPSKKMLQQKLILALDLGDRHHLRILTPDYANNPFHWFLRQIRGGP